MHETKSRRTVIMCVGEYSFNSQATNEDSEPTLSCSFSSQLICVMDLPLKQRLKCREMHSSFERTMTYVDRVTLDTRPFDFFYVIRKVAGLGTRLASELQRLARKVVG